MCFDSSDLGPRTPGFWQPNPECFLTLVLVFAFAAFEHR